MKSSAYPECSLKNVTNLQNSQVLNAGVGVSFFIKLQAGAITLFKRDSGADTFLYISRNF